MMAAKTAVALLLLAVASLLAQPALAAHGASIDGRLKYPAGFDRFDYTSRQATPGGELILHGLGSFDKTNPFTLKGTAPEGLSSLVFETLAVRSLDEPFAMYGLIAKDIALAPDGLSVTFTLNPQARFSDGKPVTAEDVKFSLDTLKGPAAHPFYQNYFRDIAKAEIIAPDQITFRFARRNRELHLIAGELPVLSKAFYTAHPFSEAGLSLPVGSGPYTVAALSPGKSITYRRNPDYWGWNQPVRRGMFNFGRITYKYYQDQTVAVEAFKAHDFDVLPVNVAKQWARDLRGPNFQAGRIIKASLPHHNDAGMQGLVMNLRRPLFQDRRVRLALNLAFDFEWTNTSLFFGQYSRCNSYFSNSIFAARGLPSPAELRLLAPFRDRLPPSVFTTPPTPISTAPPASLRRNLLKAQALLAEAGWRVKDGVLVNRAGEPFTFEILLDSTAFERPIEPYTRNLKRLGIKARYRVIDPALYSLRLTDFDFDMVVNVYGQSQSPGNEQRDYWSSAAASRPGSGNLMGLRDPVIDHLVDQVVDASTQEGLIAACRALDRVLWYGYYLIPNWYVASHRLAYWNRFSQPSTLPLYYQPGQLLMTWWVKPEAPDEPRP
ncbi:MAG: extracellular solute-binding protein [Desulfobacteraceae bacterium]|nr:extracellular solute-binding protein [Desulfobacteraceae bacterium]